jgi:hypothetical protein
MVDTLISIFNVALASAFPDIVGQKATLTPISPKQEKFGDYQCNNALSISAVFKGKNI